MQISSDKAEYNDDCQFPSAGSFFRKKIDMRNKEGLSFPCKCITHLLFLERTWKTYLAISLKLKSMSIILQMNLMHMHNSGLLGSILFCRARAYSFTNLEAKGDACYSI